MRPGLWTMWIFAIAPLPLVAQDELPQVLDDRLKIELFAENPQLVTPTGIDVDHLGRVFVIESNTHFPPEGYQGHSTDRVLILENTDANPQADKVTVFAEGFVHSMSVAVKPLWVEGLGLRVEGEKPKQDQRSSSPEPSTVNTQLFLATRSEILLLTDTDGDNKADQKRRLVHLETAGDYPHNGLAGFAFDALGNMFFGFGENLGADYKIIGSDGTTLSGGGEGGNIYRCKPDGSKLERWATGFWNPHASCFDAFGRLFTVDNDPDSRPPCRLLHIIPGGDYGYRFRNGRKGTHPFTSWNGEIPGTLPMVAGTGEAPSGIVCYENDGFPEDYLGTLLVGSWGDHRIDQFVLEPKGASFTSKAKPIIKGGENFRPVGLAVAPDGSLFFSDWVLKDYKLHGKGRVWRVSGKASNGQKPVDLRELSTTTDYPSLHIHRNSKNINVRRLAVKRMMESPIGPVVAMQEGAKISEAKDEEKRALVTRGYFELWAGMIRHQYVPKFQPFGVRETDEESLDYLMKTESGDEQVAVPHDVVRIKNFETRALKNKAKAIKPDLEKPNFIEILQYTATREYVLESAETVFTAAPKTQQNADTPWNLNRVALVLALREDDPKNPHWIKMELGCPDVKIRFMAVQWVGEEKLADLRPDVESLLSDPTTTPDLFLACLATLQLLDGKPASEFEKNPPTKYILAMVKDSSRPTSLRATALRMLPPNTPELDAPLLHELLSSPDENLQIEAVRTLANSPVPEARELLLPIAANPQASLEMRCEAIGGLCNGPHTEPLPADVEEFLLRTVLSDEETLQLEALRSLRGRALEGTNIRTTIEKAGERDSNKEAILLALGGKIESPTQPSTPAPQPAGDSSAGRRVFFHHQGPQCAKCHRVQGRGGQIGPDLTVIARTMDREKLLSSIVDPSKEISPQFTTWVFETNSGKVVNGFILEDNRTGQIKVGTPNGEQLVLEEDEIASREPSKTSVMPEKLLQQMTSQELRDLLAFLETLK